MARPGGLNGYASARSSVLGLAKVLFLCLSSAYAAPLHNALHMTKEEEHEEPDDINLWLYLTVAMVLVLAGGAFAGLTIA
jgi:metal transporter CNNM